MFAATVLVCSMATGVCVHIDDELGPFYKERDCVLRIAEDMVPAAMSYLDMNGIRGPYHIKEANCTKVEVASLGSS